MAHTPPDAGPYDEPLRYVSFNEQWLSFLYGYLEPLLSPRMWSGTPEQVDLAIERVRELMDYIMAGCDPCGIDIDIGIDGEINLILSPEITATVDTPYVHSPSTAGYDWQFYIGDQQNTLNLSGNPNSPWIPPPTPTPNQFCYAAHWIVENFSDELQDILQIIDVEINSTAQTLKLFGVIPIAGTVAQTIIEFIHEGLVQAVLNWAISNIFDLDAQFAAKEALYCAMIACEGDYDNLWDYVDFPPSLPEIVINTILDPAEWQNVKDVLDWGYNLGTGVQMGWIVLRYIQYIHAVIGVKIGLADPLSAIVARAMHASTLYNQPDCELFDCVPVPDPWAWQDSWNGEASQLGWTLVGGDGGYWYDVGETEGWSPPNTGDLYRYCAVECDLWTLEGTLDYLYCLFEYRIQDAGCHRVEIFVYFDDVEVYHDIAEWRCPAPGGVFEWAPDLQTTGSQNVKIKLVFGETYLNRYLGQTFSMSGLGTIAKDYP